ncbi:MAG TPA: bifunctional 5,10-methylenetetrahydrofolate dehydrogenase/5,10-methenyltetrahydrofolate cyclohydrolase [Thermoanaerobaculia bacterium]|nr:bifunctional 5,10-methylenetetrahydrofolate dehydrogenase/5,10-methenyltetrahydrofolate cyclohydrolase [Thermoanaerobaculia bacterium]
MSAGILDGRAVASKIEAELKERIVALASRGIRPRLVVLRVGNDPASEIYVRAKAKKAVELGIDAEPRHLPDTLSEEALLGIIASLNKDQSVDGILVQLPLPPQIAASNIIEAIDPRKDVDGFHPSNVGRLQLGRAMLVPCTPAGIMRLLDSAAVPLKGAHAVVIGRSDIVGKPAAALLLQRDATVTICHSKTRDLASIVGEADIVIAAVGKPHLIRGEMIKRGAIVIDVGVNRLDRSEENLGLLQRTPLKLRTLEEKGSVLVGDVEFTTASERASWITPVPGGVGPLTIAMLMENSVTACEARHR